MIFRRPILLNQLEPDVSTSLGQLSGLEGLTRAIMVGVIPLFALETFGSKEVLSGVYFATTLFTLLFTLNLPLLEGWFNRRGLVTIGVLFLFISVFLLYTRHKGLFALGIGMRAAGASIFSVMLSLYIMDFIGKKELTKNESRRMLYLGAAWLIGPALGGWFVDRDQAVWVYWISALAAIGVMTLFWRLRLGNDAVIKKATSRSKNPVKSIVRFSQQPNLRIAYLITFSRACFWVLLFVYGPIYVLEAGLPSWVSGLLLSGASGLLFFSPYVERLSGRFGTRQVLIGCLVIIGVCVGALGIIGEAQPMGVLFLALASFGGAGMDVLVNIPFMRLVKPRERTEMTTVFTTWRESSSLVTQGVIFLVLLVAPFWVFYFLLAGLQIGTAVATTYLPRRI